jgi:hypothetical protein
MEHQGQGDGAKHRYDDPIRQGADAAKIGFQLKLKSRSLSWGRGRGEGGRFYPCVTVAHDTCLRLPVRFSRFHGFLSALFLV